MACLRKGVTIVLAAAVGIHCSASPEVDSGTVANTDVVTAEPSPPSAEPNGPPAETAPPRDVDPTMSVTEATAAPSVVTSTVRGEDGALYVTGLFHGSLTMGDETLMSRGADDVFLARYEADGKIAWSRAIGSVLAERSPHVTMTDGRVRLVARTRGEVDCGSGDHVGMWSSDMFFVCLFGADGTAMGGGTFPTGSP